MKPPHRPALTGKQVKAMIQKAASDGDMEVAGMLAIARHYMPRVPSEAVPLEWNGARSKVEISEAECVITLANRKNRRFPSTLKRTCCCRESGRWLCSVHWLLKLRSTHTPNARVFTIDKIYFARRVKELAEHVGVPEASNCGTHSLRRGMAQDIMDMGGSLPALLNAGDWSSSAYLKYLRVSQTDDTAVAKAMMLMSGSEDEQGM